MPNLMSLLPLSWWPVVLLIGSNIFMTYAWYGHVKDKNQVLWQAVLLSWGIAFIEYWMAIPANRIGVTAGYTVGQLKIIQEVISLMVFTVYAASFLGEPIKWNHLAAFGCLIGAVVFIFWEKIVS